MVNSKTRTPKHLRSKSKSKSKVASASLSPLKPKLKRSEKTRRRKKIRDEGSAHGKSGKCISSENRVPTKYDSDLEEAYADQCNRYAVSALTHFNKVAASKMGVTYELVKAGESTGFMHEKEGFMFHLNFLAKPTKCTDESETMLFFGEVWEIYPEEPRVTNCCILGSADAVCSGTNGCGACRPVIHHPAEGFYVGGEQFLLYFG